MNAHYFLYYIANTILYIIMLYFSDRHYIIMSTIMRESMP